MSIEIAIGLPTYATADEAYAAKPYLLPGSVYRDGAYWRGVDARDGTAGIVGQVSSDVLMQEAGNGFTNGNAGFAGFGSTKQGELYGDTSGGDTGNQSAVSASLFGGGLVPLPGLGVFGNGKYNWVLWGLVAAAVLLIATSKGGKAPRGRFAAR